MRGRAGAAAGHRRAGAGTALVNLVRRNGRRYGGYIVHIGVLLIALGIIGNEFYQSEGQANLTPGESITVANYTLTYEQAGRQRRARTTPSSRAAWIIATNGRPTGQIVAQEAHLRQEPGTADDRGRPAPGALEDVYVVLAGFDNMGETASFKVFINPLMSWMWVGGLVIAWACWLPPGRGKGATTSEVRARAPGVTQPAR